MTGHNSQGRAQKAAGATSVARFRLARGSKTGPPQPGKRVIGRFRAGLLTARVKTAGATRAGGL